MVADMHTYLTSTMLLILPLISATSAARDTWVCPDSIHIASATMRLDPVPPGYDVVVPKSRVRLTGFNVFDGPPEREAALKPRALSATDVTWELDGDYPQGVFLSCDYREGLIRLVVRAPDAVRSCSARTEVAKPHDTLRVRFTCRRNSAPGYHGHDGGTQ